MFKGITMDEAVDKGARFVGPDGNMEKTGADAIFNSELLRRMQTETLKVGWADLMLTLRTHMFSDSVLT